MRFTRSLGTPSSRGERLALYSAEMALLKGAPSQLASCDWLISHSADRGTADPQIGVTKKR